MQRILLLGGFGFIGTNILNHIDRFLSGEYSVIVFDRVLTHPFGLRFKCVEKVYTGDFGDTVLMNSIFESVKIDHVFHFISVSVPSSSSDCIFDINHNVIPTIQLLEIMHNHDVHNILFLSSGGAVYGDKCLSSAGHSEREVLYPKSPYGISKLVIEKYLIQHNVLCGIMPIIIRLSNPYGPFHYSNKQGVVNISLRNAFNGVVQNVWGDGNGRKDYIYIEDFSEILFLILGKANGPLVVNVGSGSLNSVNEIMHSIKRIYPEFDWCYSSENRLDVKDFKLDLSLLHSIIGPYTFTGLEDGLMKCKQWMENK